MALIRCAECKKEVSSTAVSCPHCGFALGGGGSAVNSAFEKRIEEYKKAGYIQIKRDSNSATMRHTHKYAKDGVKSMLIFGLLFIIGILALFFIFYFTGSETIAYIVVVVLGLFLLICLMRMGANALTVNITVSQGKIAESGNVLKRK